MTKGLYVFFILQIPLIAGGGTIQKPFCSHLWTSQDGHPLNWISQGTTRTPVLSMPYTAVQIMVPHLE